ncbi:sodium/potassium-transporting ATPase subunit gamma isoform X1 [Pseudopipra pipra]|uniref:sodium/potassium-transporting ATPase subunit gamma isoform X1 n=1 Tax=Pseudopipra pipra TaxID=415032 RepID=UPI003138F41D
MFNEVCLPINALSCGCPTPRVRRPPDNTPRRWVTSKRPSRAWTGSATASGSTAEGRRSRDKGTRRTCRCRAAVPPWKQSSIQILAKGHPFSCSNGSTALQGQNANYPRASSPSLRPSESFLANKVQAQRG